jgi:Zn-dependent protease with chaperone function
MTATSPDHALFRLVLAAIAIVVLPLAVVATLSATAIGARSSQRLSSLCVWERLGSFDMMLHAMALIIAFTSVGLAIAVICAAGRQRRALRELHQVTREARLSGLPVSVAAAARTAGVVGLVDLVANARPFGFVYGWRCPRICVSTGLIARLSAQELEAVLRHEAWHLRRRDPLRFWIVHSILVVFRFVPIMSRLGHQVILVSEIAADRHVVITMGTPRALASALLKVADESLLLPAFAGYLDARVAALAGEPLLTRPPRAIGRLALTALVGETLLLASVIGQNGLSALTVLWVQPIC